MSALLAVAAFAGPLLLAAFYDLKSFRIPNALVAVMALLYPAAAFLLGHGSAIPAHLLAAAVVLAASLPLFVFRLMGGGDVKLLSAAALWLGGAPLLDFLLVTAVLGGVFALVLLVLRRLGKSALTRIPYGVPIAAAGLVMAPAILLAP
jgi:prepilin peptidase CpaA